MHIVQVSVHVKPDQIESFKAAVLENAQNSLREPGVARFDILQQAGDPTRFLMVEVYRTPEDPARHKETPHYKTWRAAVEPMMAEPRRSIVYGNFFPNDPGWGQDRSTSGSRNSKRKMRNRPIKPTLPLTGFSFVIFHFAFHRLSGG